jgi:hypothetical protein
LEISKETLEFCDQLIDGVTLAANHPEFDALATRIGNAKREIAMALIESGGIPLGAQRQVVPGT